MVKNSNAFVKYTTKNRITSYPELLLDTYIHSGPISHSLIFSLLPNYRQEIVRGTLKYSLVDDRADRFYYAELEDYIVTIETYNNERVYSFTAYDRNSQQEFFVTLENDTYSLSKEEISFSITSCLKVFPTIFNIFFTYSYCVG